MLDIGDAIVLPTGVRVDGTVLVDDARDARYPANDTALFVLRRAGLPLGTVAAELARWYRLPPDRARDDVLRFAQSLNVSQLANVVHGAGCVRRAADWARLALRLAPAGTLPAATVRRSVLDTSTPFRAARTAMRAVARRAVGLTVAAVLLASPGRVAPGVLALAVGVGLGVAVHEAGHAAGHAALVPGVCAALVVAGVRTYVVHPALSPGRRSLVAVAGPCAATLLGAGVVVVAWLARMPELALAGTAPAAHAVGLTTATGDGRAACGL